VLYPVGVASEMKLVYDGLPVLKERGLHSIRLPNAWNFGFDYATLMSVRPSTCLPGLSGCHHASMHPLVCVSVCLSAGCLRLAVTCRPPQALSGPLIHVMSCMRRLVCIDQKLHR
jgi:Protein tyrosine phosphatase-like protein, PTPLA